MVFAIKGAVFPCQAPHCTARATSRLTASLVAQGFDLCREHLDALSQDIHRHRLALGEDAARMACAQQESASDGD